MISVQQAAFDLGHEMQWLQAQHPGQVGALASFVGLVRDLNGTRPVDCLTLEHYPGMTETALAHIVADAEARWPLLGCRVIHRYGPLQVDEAIVFVGVTSAHRQAAFDACAFIMDRLKTDAPFWKLETGAEGEHWVEARESDQVAAARWRKEVPHGAG